MHVRKYSNRGQDKMRLVALTALFLLAVVNAQPVEDYKCVSPPRWKGNFREIDYDSLRGRFANISYDQYEEAINLVEIERNPESPTPFTELIREVLLFRQRMMYRVDLRASTCEEFPLTEEFRPIGISSDTEFNGVNYIGAELTGLGVKVDEYYRPDRIRGDFSASVAPFGRECIPVLESYIHSSHGPPPSRSTNTAIQFMNIIPVTSFPSGTFEKPYQCQ